MPLKLEPGAPTLRRDRSRASLLRAKAIRHARRHVAAAWEVLPPGHPCWVATLALLRRLEASE